MRSAPAMNRARTASQKWFKTNQVCNLFDVSRATLFRWEREGMISVPPRDWRNWRLYSTHNVDEIKRLIQARKLQP